MMNTTNDMVIILMTIALQIRLGLHLLPTVLPCLSNTHPMFFPATFPTIKYSEHSSSITHLQCMWSNCVKKCLWLSNWARFNIPTNTL